MRFYKISYFEPTYKRKDISVDDTYFNVKQGFEQRVINRVKELNKGECYMHEGHKYYCPDFVVVRID